MRSRQNLRNSSRVSTGKRTNCGIELSGLFLNSRITMPSRFDVGHRVLVLAENLALERRIRIEPLVLDHPMVAAEAGALGIVAAFGRPAHVGFGPGGPGEFVKRRAVNRAVLHASVETFPVSHTHRVALYQENLLRQARSVSDVAAK